MTQSTNKPYAPSESEVIWRYQEGFLTAKGFIVYTLRLLDEQGNPLIGRAQLKDYCLKHGMSAATYYRTIKLVDEQQKAASEETDSSNPS